jgi:hypothetical protein
VGPRTGLDDVEGRKSFLYRKSNSDPSTIQPITSLYTDRAILALCLSVFLAKLNILNSECMCVFRFDLGECIELLGVGTSFQLTLFSFYAIIALFSLAHVSTGTATTSSDFRFVLCKVFGSKRTAHSENSFVRRVFGRVALFLVL